MLRSLWSTWIQNPRGRCVGRFALCNVSSYVLKLFVLDGTSYSNVELYVRPSTLLLSEPPVPMPSSRDSTDEWSPWPVTRPKVLAQTDKLNMARARLGVIIRDMLELQRRHGAVAMDTEYLDAAQTMYARYQDWMNFLEPTIQTCELASQQHILLQ